jgi:hypothetical protein
VVAEGEAVELFFRAAVETTEPTNRLETVVGVRNIVNSRCSKKVRDDQKMTILQVLAVICSCPFLSSCRSSNRLDSREVSFGSSRFSSSFASPEEARPAHKREWNKNDSTMTISWAFAVYNPSSSNRVEQSAQVAVS